MSLDAGLLAQEPGDDDDGDAEDGEIRVLISTPSGQMPARQGPFLLAPAPHELSEVREAKASDMTVLRVPASPVEDGDTAFAVLAIVSDDGRVDLGVLPSIFPRWGGGARTKARKMGRYGLVRAGMLVCMAVLTEFSVRRTTRMTSRSTRTRRASCLRS
jgi:hypothetical protein